jgi:phage gpG-like protein
MASIFFNFPNKQDFELVINQLGDLQDTTPVMARIFSLLKRYIRKNFEEEGHPANWVPLKKDIQLLSISRSGGALCFSAQEIHRRR